MVELLECEHTSNWHVLYRYYNTINDDIILSPGFPIHIILGTRDCTCATSDGPYLSLVVTCGGPHHKMSRSHPSKHFPPSIHSNSPSPNPNTTPKRGWSQIKGLVCKKKRKFIFLHISIFMKGRNPAFIEKIFQARRDPMHKDPTPHPNYLIFTLWPLKKIYFFFWIHPCLFGPYLTKHHGGHNSWWGPPY